VSLAIDGTLYSVGSMEVPFDEIASLIGYDRAFAANCEALGHIRSGELLPG
jgi:hypothetical protein